jgi:hypothetical protein
MADKKSLRSFAELRSALKRTESDSEANALVKSSAGTRKTPVRPVLTEAPVSRPRHMTPVDRFIAAALEIDLTKLTDDALHHAYVMLGKALNHANQATVSIRTQLDSKDPSADPEWHGRALGALRHKTFEIDQLQRTLALCESMMAKAKPAPAPVVKLVPPPPPPPAAYEIRDDVPLPAAYGAADAAWRKYPFDKLKVGQSFRFEPEVTAKQVRAFIVYAQRSLGWRFSYRVERDKVCAVWRIAEDTPKRGEKK